MKDSQGERCKGQSKRMLWTIMDSVVDCGEESMRVSWGTVKESVVDCGGHSRRVLWTVEDSQE